MARTIWLIPIGAIAGSAAVLAVFATVPERDRALPAAGIDIVEVNPGEPATASPIPAPGAFSASLTAHEQAAAATSFFEIERMLERLVDEPGSVQRDTELAALLTQLASFDPSGALELIRRFDLGDDALAGVFQAWVGIDTEEALVELGRLWPPATQRTVALAMLDVLGANEAGIDRIAEIFGPSEAMSFRIDAIGKLAAINPEAATAAADKIEISATQTIAQQRIAVVMAGVNPLRALEYASTMSIPIQRQRFMDQLLDNWAKLDPEGMFEYMESADLTQMAVSANSFRALATTSPGKLLALAEKFAPAQRIQAQRAALEAMTALDPVAAYASVSSLPLSADRDNFINSVARQYAAQNPEGALAWVSSLAPPSPVAFNAVLSTVAADNPMRVAEAIIAEIVNPAAANRADMPSVMNLLNGAMQAQSPEISRIADMLANHSDPRVRMQLSQLVVRWPQTDPESALAWAMRNPDNLTATTAPQFAQLLATQNPTLARQSLQRLPADLRGPWIQGAASGMARTDLNGTLDWIESFRDEPAYQSAVDSALSAAASTQPELVASYLEDAPDFLQRLAPMVASSWAARDSEAAAEWVSGLPAADQAQLGSAAGNVAARWADRDARAAESWVLDLPAGPTRDEGLSGLLQSSAGRGSVETRLLDEYSSPAARARGVMNTMFELGRSDPDLARELIDRHISDPGQRAQAEQMLDAASRLPSGIALPSGAVIRSSSGANCIQVVNGNTVVMPC